MMGVWKKNPDTEVVLLGIVNETSGLVSLSDTTDGARDGVCPRSGVAHRPNIGTDKVCLPGPIRLPQEEGDANKATRTWRALILELQSSNTVDTRG